MANPLTVEEVTLSDAARRLTEIKACPFDYKDMSTLCKLFGIRLRNESGNRRMMRAEDFARIVDASQTMAAC